MRLRRRRFIATFAVLLLAAMAMGPAVLAATPPDITVDAATVDVDEGQTAEMGGTFTEADGDTVTLSADVGTIEADPDNAGRWIWSMPVPDGPASTVVTVKATDTDGFNTATFTVNALNIPPVASTTGPHFVPIFSASDRVFEYTATDVPGDTLTNTADCGTGTVKATGDTADPDVKTLRCQWPDSTTTLVGVQSTDKDGATTDGRINVRATANVASVADAVIRLDGPAGGDQLGGAIGTPDLNHDGKADLAIGGTTTSNQPVVDPGYVIVAFGRATFATLDLGALGAGAGIRIDGPSGVGFGRSLANAGDLNGDGIDDLLIGAEGAASGKGVVYVVFGSATIADLDVTTMTAAQGATITGSTAGDLTGRAIAGVGDVNGDGHDDIVIGSPGLASGAGGVDVVFGGTSFTNVNLAALAARGVHISGAGAGSGSSVAGGDVNGDTRADVVIGSGTGHGSNATVVYGQTAMSNIDASALTSGQGFKIGGDEDLGITAVGSGDMDGDGFADIVIVHPGFDWAASIVRGASTNTSIDHLATSTSARVLRIAAPSDTLGNDVAMGDTNHDGRSDALIGAALDGNNGEGAGSAFLVRGAAVLTDENFDVLDTHWVRIDGDVTHAFAGDAVAIGDVDGDGIGDPAVGAPGAVSWDSDSLDGRVGVFFGLRPDTTKPTVTAPKRSIPVGLALHGASPVIRISWTGADAGSGIDHYVLAQRTNTGAWVTVGATANKHLDRALSTGKDYRFRVRAVDAAGNESAWVMGTTFHLGGYQDTVSTVKYTGSWSTSRSTSYAGGTTHFASVSGRKASLTFTGRQVVLAAPTGPTRGSAKVYINGKFVGSISLFSATSQASKVVGSWSWTSSAKRTITIKVSGTSGHPRVDVDKFITVR